MPDRAADVLDFADPQLSAKLRNAIRRGSPAWARPHEEDLLQAVRAKLHEASLRYQRTHHEPLPAAHRWRIAYTTTVDEIRRLGIRRTATLESQPIAGTASPEHTAYASQIAEAIRGCLGKLKLLRREAATMYLQGHSIPETARVLGWAPKRAENLVYRGMAELRACLTRRGVQP